MDSGISTIGNLDLIADYLGINLAKQSNIPLTLLGNGLLYNGYFGAILYKLISFCAS